MHEGNQLGHFGHFDPLGHQRTDSTAYQQASQNPSHACCGNFGAQFEGQGNGGEHGDGHADHAEGIADA